MMIGGQFTIQKRRIMFDNTVKNNVRTSFDLSWKVVLFPHVFMFHIDDIVEVAKKMGYPYFFWNGDVRRTEDLIISEYTVG